MKAKIVILAMLVALVPLALHAQNSYLLGSHSCPNFLYSYYCDNVPVTNMDGTWPTPNNSENGFPPYVFLDLIHNGQDNQFFMNGNGGYGSYTVKTLVDKPDPSGSGVHDVDVTFTDPTVKLHFAYTTGTRHCVGRTCVTPGEFISGQFQTGINIRSIRPRPLDYWCPGTESAAVGIFLVNFTIPTPYRYCEGMYGGEFAFQQITWGDYWDWRGILGY